MKRCAFCRQELALDSFYRDGRGHVSARCRDCHGLGERTCRRCGTTYLGSAKMVLCSDACRRAERPPTFRDCAHCGQRFGPLDHLARRFCCVACKVAAQRTGHRVHYVLTVEAKRAHHLVRWAVASGRLQRASACEICGRERRLEAAHRDYARPLDIRWLCVPCHRRWDAGMPKGGAVAVQVDRTSALPRAA